MKKTICFLFISISFLFLTGCSHSDLGNKEITEQETIEASETEEIKDTSYDKKGLSSINDMENCNLEEYGMDCNLVKFLEENLAWIVSPTGVDFCSYQSLGNESYPAYLQVLCDEFYVQDKKITCPDEKSKEECFLAKDPERAICKEKCRIEQVNPYLVTASGVSIPVKISKENGTFSLWEPRDGNLYMKDLKENFPKEIYDNLQNIDKRLFPKGIYDDLRNIDSGVLQAINIERAEKYFGAKIGFEVLGDLEKSCEKYEDCGSLPFKYGLRSGCPHEVKCLENKCVAGCYDFRDYTKFPLIEKCSWENVVDLINSGKIKAVFQDHSLNVQLELKNGSNIFVKEPEIDAVFDVIDECGKLCSGIAKATE